MVIRIDNTAVIIMAIPDSLFSESYFTGAKRPDISEAPPYRPYDRYRLKELNGNTSESAAIANGPHIDR
jgi:hypothetical protein